MFVVGSIILLPLYILGRKSPEVASRVVWVIIISIVVFLGAWVLIYLFAIVWGIFWGIFA